LSRISKPCKRERGYQKVHLTTSVLTGNAMCLPVKRHTSATNVTLTLVNLYSAGRRPDAEDRNGKNEKSLSPLGFTQDLSVALSSNKTGDEAKK
jgi:hypothetical protein